MGLDGTGTAKIRTVLLFSRGACSPMFGNNSVELINVDPHVSENILEVGAFGESKKECYLSKTVSALVK